MSGRGPRWIPVKKGITVELAGALNAQYAYAKIDGVTYTQAATVETEQGSSIEFTVGASNTAYQASCKVTLDGAAVLSGAGTYKYTGKNSVQATFSVSGSGRRAYYTCAIVTV